MPLCRNQLQATQTARKRGDSHPSGARIVGQPVGMQDSEPEKRYHRSIDKIIARTLYFSNYQKERSFSQHQLIRPIILT